MPGWFAYVYAGFVFFLFVPEVAWQCVKMHRAAKRMERFTEEMRAETARIERRTEEIRRRCSSTP